MCFLNARAHLYWLQQGSAGISVCAFHHSAIFSLPFVCTRRVVEVDRVWSLWYRRSASLQFLHDRFFMHVVQITAYQLVVQLASVCCENWFLRKQVPHSEPTCTLDILSPLLKILTSIECIRINEHLFMPMRMIMFALLYSCMNIELLPVNANNILPHTNLTVTLSNRSFANLMLGNNVQGLAWTKNPESNAIQARKIHVNARN